MVGLLDCRFKPAADIGDIDRAVRALEWLVDGDIQGIYRVGCDGSFTPEGYVEPLLFDLPARTRPAAPAMASV